jgi:hypothetical protein
MDTDLVYPESCFALEPSTVRVREVGIGRGERRTRRERERQLNEIASTTLVPASDASPHAIVSPGLHPADPTRANVPSRSPTPDDPTFGDEGLSMEFETPSRSPSPVPPPRTTSRQAVGPTPTTRAVVSQRPPTPSLEPSADPTSRPKQVLPYSTFQQLPFVPPLSSR